MTIKDINTIIETLCPNDEDYEKPCISPKYLRQELEQLALEQEQKMLEPTTKHDLAVDCISRESVLKLIYDYKENHSNDREHYPINYGTLLDMIRWVRKLPSITPQPRKGHWMGEGDFITCSCCNEMSYPFDSAGYGSIYHNYCPNCGSKNEVEE